MNLIRLPVKSTGAGDVAGGQSRSTDASLQKLAGRQRDQAAARVAQRKLRATDRKPSRS